MAAPKSVSRATIVHVITRLELGGAQENTLYTCQHLDPERYQVVLVYGPGGMLDEVARASDRVRCIEVPELIREMRPQQDLIAAQKLRRILGRLKEEHQAQGFESHRFIVHTHSSKAGILGRLSARASGAPYIIHSIHGFGFYPGQDWRKFALFLNAERLAGYVTDAFISVSESNLSEAKQRGLVPKRAHTRVIRSGMRLDAYRLAPSREDARRALDLASSAELVLCVGNFKPQKDPLTLIEAFRRLHIRRPHTELLIAGDGPLRPQVERAIEQAGLRSHVHLLGWRKDIPLLLAATNAVVLASIFEGLPRSAVQAVAARRPFVGTWVNGTPEIIRNGRNGYLVPPKNPEALACALVRTLVEHPLDPADEIRVRAWEADTMVEQQAELYETLMQ